MGAETRALKGRSSTVVRRFQYGGAFQTGWSAFQIYVLRVQTRGCVSNTCCAFQTRGVRFGYTSYAFSTWCVLNTWVRFKTPGVRFQHVVRVQTWGAI